MHVYVGAPGSGKTFLADIHGRTLAGARGVGGLCIDSTGSSGLEHWKRAESVSDAVDAVWDRNELVRYTPGDVDELQQLLGAARNPGRCVFLLDEVALWPARLKELDHLCRTWRHTDTDVLVTAQHLSGDIAQGLRACSPRLYAFRQAPSTTLDLLSKEWKLPEDQLQTLGQGDFLMAGPIDWHALKT